MTARRESLGITSSLDDTGRAEAASLQARALLKTAVGTGLVKQKDIQMEQATSSLSLEPRSCLQTATLTSHPGMPDIPHLCISEGAA